MVALRTPLAAGMNRELGILRISIYSRSRLGPSKGTRNIGFTGIELVVVGGERIKSFGSDLSQLIRKLSFSIHPQNSLIP